MAVQIIQSPSVKEIKYRSIFLAGGIQDCPDWRSDAIKLIKKVCRQEKSDVTIINPLRESFTPDLHKAQVQWETAYLEVADLVLFWFPKETLCPMTLYEFGWMLNSGRNMIIGAHPEYARFNDLRFRLEAHHGILSTSLEEMMG